MKVKEMIELLKLMPEDNIVMAAFSEFKEHGSVEDVLLGSGTLEGFCYLRLDADEWRLELDKIKKDIMSNRVKLEDVLDLVNTLNDNGGFRDYSDYSQMFDDVASLAKDMVVCETIDREEFNKIANEVGDELDDSYAREIVSSYANSLEDRLFGGAKNETD